jgi:hypothetical protein
VKKLNTSDGYVASGTSPTQRRDAFKSSADFSVENHFTIFLLRPLTPAAESWIDEHIAEDAQYFGNAIVVEHRYIADIVQGIQNDGLAVV